RLLDRWQRLYSGMDLETLAAAKEQEDAKREQGAHRFVELAEGDDFDTSRYPDFEEYYASLNTHLDRDVIRRYIRLFVRDQVADLREKPFPGNQFLGDYQEDNQLQLAIVELLKTMGGDAAQIPQFARFAEVKGKPPAKPNAVEEEVLNRR
ncbi:MAG: hypothetical protein V2A76_14720, partial [Planctomycetota bacterium]